MMLNPGGGLAEGVGQRYHDIRHISFQYRNKVSNGIWPNDMTGGDEVKVCGEGV